jgi:hypothetical protein
MSDNKCLKCKGENSPLKIFNWIGIICLGLFGYGLSSIIPNSDDKPVTKTESTYQSFDESMRIARSKLSVGVEQCKMHNDNVKSLSSCLLTVIDRGASFAYDHRRLSFELPRDIQLYLSELAVEAVKNSEYNIAEELMQQLDLGIFTNANIITMSKGVGSFTPSKNDLHHSVMRQLFHSGLAFDVYEGLKSKAVYELNNNSKSDGASQLRALLIHYGCMKTAEVWSEITSDYGSNIPQGAEYLKIPLNKKDQDIVTKQRLLLRRYSVVPTLQGDCPILLADDTLLTANQIDQLMEK